MSSSFDDFWNEFQQRFSRAPVWLPGTPMALGDIGVVDRRGYLRIAALSDFGINFQETLASVESEYSVTSTNATAEDFAVNAAGRDPSRALSSVEVGMRVNFSAAGGFVVRAQKVRGSIIRDVLSVENQIRHKQAEKPFWHSEWIYVQEIISAQPCILIVAAAAGARATVRASVDAGLSSFLQLLRAGIGLSLVDQSSIDQYVATLGRSPLMWRGRWLRGLFRKSFRDRLGSGWAESELTGAEQPYVDFDEPAAFDRDLPRPLVQAIVS